MGLLSCDLPAETVALLLPPLVVSRAEETARIAWLADRGFVIIWEKRNVELLEKLDAPMAKFKPEDENDPLWWAARGALDDGFVRMAMQTQFDLVKSLRAALAFKTSTIELSSYEAPIQLVCDALNKLAPKTPMTPDTIAALETVMRLGGAEAVTAFLGAL